MSSTLASAELADLPAYCEAVANKAQAASRALAGVSGRQRAGALRCIAGALEGAVGPIQAANAEDLAAGEAAGLSQAMLDRLRLDDPRIHKMAASVRQVAAQVDPVGQVLEGRVLPNGIELQKVRVPIGVVLIIFESRPNVTSDAAALCLKSGNAVILRGGKEARHSNSAIARCVQQGLAEAGLPENAVQVIETTDRAAVGELLKKDGQIDLCIPRGGESLIRAVVQQAHIPVIKHYTGNCHIFVDEHADADMAIDLCVNAKTQRPGVCNAVETILIHENAAGDNGNAAGPLLTRLCQALADQGVTIRGDATVCQCFAGAEPASEADWGAEYLDLIVAMRVVGSLDEATAHINRFGSRHTDAIVTTRIDAAERFVQQVDSANVFVNSSTRFSDGGEYGLGAEIGISTDKLHARGPMGAADLTTYKWVARGTGQVRE